MKANLMSPSCDRKYVQICVFGKFLERAVVSDCCPAFIRLNYGHFLTHFGITPDSSINPAGWRGRMTIDQSQVIFVHFTEAELFLEPAVAAVVLRQQDNAGGISIQ